MARKYYRDFGFDCGGEGHICRFSPLCMFHRIVEETFAKVVAA